MAYFLKHDEVSGTSAHHRPLGKIAFGSPNDGSSERNSQTSRIEKLDYNVRCSNEDPFGYLVNG